MLDFVGTEVGKSMWRGWSVLTFLGVFLLGSGAYAQDDPCLEGLESEQELVAYDEGVGEYLEAADGDDAQAKVDALDKLLGICDLNLRLRVLRADALAELGDCGAAQAAYDEVFALAPQWSDPVNAQDAKERAEEGYEALRRQCLAQVQINCVTQNARVGIGALPEQACPAKVEVAAGDYDVVVSADGMESVSRHYTFSPGSTVIEIGALAVLERVGTVEFACEEEGVEIIIGAERFGCPATRVRAPGELYFTAARPQGEPFHSSVIIEEGKVSQAFVPRGVVETAQSSGQGTLSVECETQGVRLDVSDEDGQGRVTSMCPAAFQLLPGRYQVNATAPGYAPQERVVEISSGERVALQLALESEGGADFGIGLKAGYGLGLVLQQDPNEVGRDESNYSHKEGESLSVIRVAAFLEYKLQETLYLDFGLSGRWGVGDRSASAFGGFADIGLAGEGLRLWAGLSALYGDTARTIKPLEEQQGEISLDKYEGGDEFLPGVRMGLSFEYALGMAIGIDMEILIDDLPVMDLSFFWEMRI